MKSNQKVTIDPIKFKVHFDHLMKMELRTLPADHPWINDVRSRNELILKRAINKEVATVTSIYSGDYINLRFTDGFECGVELKLLTENGR